MRAASSQAGSWQDFPSLHRQSILVSDIDRSPTLYRGVLGAVSRFIPPTEFISREAAGKPGQEAGVIDFDGLLMLLYGLKMPNGD